MPRPVRGRHESSRVEHHLIGSSTQRRLGFVPRVAVSVGEYELTRYWVLESQAPAHCVWVWFQPTGPTRTSRCHVLWQVLGWCLVVV